MRNEAIQWRPLLHSKMLTTKARFKMARLIIEIPNVFPNPNLPSLRTVLASTGRTVHYVLD